MDEMGMPFGVAIQPFIVDKSFENNRRAVERLNNPKVEAQHIARCSNCGAYINPLCDITAIRWFCCICMGRNPFLQRMQTRYRHINSNMLQETQDLLADYRSHVLPGHTSLPSSKRPLVHIFLVQESMKLDRLQTTVNALKTAVASMHPDIHVVLLTFSNRIGIYNLTKQRETKALPIPSIAPLYDTSLIPEENLLSTKLSSTHKSSKGVSVDPTRAPAPEPLTPSVEYISFAVVDDSEEDDHGHPLQELLQPQSTQTAARGMLPRCIKNILHSRLNTGKIRILTPRSPLHSSTRIRETA